MKYLKNQFKLYSSVFAAAALFAIVSCSPARNDSNQSSQLPEQQQNNIVNSEPEANTSENDIVTDEIAEPVSETAAQQATEENNGQVMINPPHGQPGHRCDIPVGQPLTATTASNTNEQVMINPPHGEPGHRCDIPVGQPLNAAPANNTVSAGNTAPTLANNPMAPTIENARRLNGSQTRQTTPTTTASGERINPPHGQPGHRCDIPVGSPLP